MRGSVNYRRYSSVNGGRKQGATETLRPSLYETAYAESQAAGTLNLKIQAR